MKNKKRTVVQYDILSQKWSEVDGDALGLGEYKTIVIIKDDFIRRFLLKLKKLLSV